MLLNFSSQDESQCNRGSNHPQGGVHCPRETERTRRPHPLLKILDVEAERSRRKGPGDINSASDAVQLGVTLPQPVGKLHRAEQQSARTGNSMRQQIPLKRLVMLPYRIRTVDEKTLVVTKYVGHHQSYEGEQKIFRTQPRTTLKRRSS